MTQHCFKLPSCIIDRDSRLSPAARKIAATMYAYRRGTVCAKSYRDLGEKAHCAINTVRSAVDELHRCGVIEIKKTHRWDPSMQRVVRDRNVYTLLIPVKRNYTLIPFSLLLNPELTLCAFSVSMYLVYAAGTDRKKAFPSISQISEAIGVAQSTVCKALAAFRRTGAVIVQRCKTVTGRFTHNSYYLIYALKKAAVTAQNAISAKISDYAARIPSKIHMPLMAVVGHLLRSIRRLKDFFKRGCPIFDIQRRKQYNDKLTIEEEANASP